MGTDADMRIMGTAKKLRMAGIPIFNPWQAISLWTPRLVIRTPVVDQLFEDFLIHSPRVRMCMKPMTCTQHHRTVTYVEGVF